MVKYFDSNTRAEGQRLQKCAVPAQACVCSSASDCASPCCLPRAWVTGCHGRSVQD